jgi:quinolinate synthase
VPVDEYERMRETIEVLSHPEAIRTIRRGRREFAEGKTVELEEFWRKEMNATNHVIIPTEVGIQT